MQCGAAHTTRILQRVEDTPSHYPTCSVGRHRPSTPHCVGPKTHHHELHHIILPHRHPHLPQRTHHQRGTRAGAIRLHLWHCKKSEMPNLPYRRHCRPYTHVRIIAVIPVAGLVHAASEDRQQQVAESKSTFPRLSWLGTRVCWI